jgi:hypothetical protein
MIDAIFSFPWAFWLVVALLVCGVVSAVEQISKGTGFPMLAVLGTTGFWYVGDALYNDYANYTGKFTSSILEDAWLEVAWFLVAFLILVHEVHRFTNRAYLRRSSHVSQMLQVGITQPLFQRRLEQLFKGCAIVWLLVAIFAATRLGTETPYYFFPFLGYGADPWSRTRVGGGLEALLSFASYLQLFVAASFGVVSVLTQNHRVRFFAMIGCLLTWPYYIFSRTRNTMLAATMPAVLSWVFLRLRGRLDKKLFVLLGFLLLAEAWLGFVIANRSTMSIARAFSEKGFSFQTEMDVRHKGLNMFEELCWINTFIETGDYQPNWGERYFAELVNPIPRGLWPGKPFIGIDYAIMRGFRGGSEAQAGVFATISTGFIGQGVANFGRILGPPFAALLLSFWVAILARLDLHGDEIGRLPLYALGIVLTFNLGRDITFITLYPFVFGCIIVWGINYYTKATSTLVRENRPRLAGKATT